MHALQHEITSLLAEAFRPVECIYLLAMFFGRMGVSGGVRFHRKRSEYRFQGLPPHYHPPRSSPLLDMQMCQFERERGDRQGECVAEGNTVQMGRGNEGCTWICNSVRSPKLALVWKNERIIAINSLDNKSVLLWWEKSEVLLPRCISPCSAFWRIFITLRVFESSWEACSPCAEEPTGCNSPM